MNPEPNQYQRKATVAYAIAVLCASLIVAVLVVVMRQYTRPPAPNANRAAERAKALSDLRAAEGEALNNAGWVDVNKGIVRLKVEDAVKMVQQMHDPGLVRSNLLVRVDKAYPPPPPPPPNLME